MVRNFVGGGHRWGREAVDDGKKMASRRFGGCYRYNWAKLDNGPWPHNIED